MQEEFVIKNHEELKAFSNKVKSKILNIMFDSDKPMSAQNIASILNEAHSKVNYHVQGLKKVGLIELVEKKEKGGVIEKYYRPAARVFRVDRSLLDFDENVDDMNDNLKGIHRHVVKKIYDNYSNWINKHLNTESSKEAQVIYNTIYLNEEEVEQLKKKLLDEFMEIQRNKSNTTGRKPFHIGMLLFPNKQ